VKLSRPHNNGSTDRIDAINVSSTGTSILATGISQWLSEVGATHKSEEDVR